MPQCPKCGKNIDSLQEWDKGWKGYDFSIGADGALQYESLHFDDFSPTGEEEFNCPECQETLFLDADEATKFLKEGIVERGLSEDRQGNKQ